MKNLSLCSRSSINDDSTSGFGYFCGTAEMTFIFSQVLVQLTFHDCFALEIKGVSAQLP